MSANAKALCGMNPWQRLQMREPSVFSSDSHFTAKPAKKPAKQHALGIGPLSEKGAAVHDMREANRKGRARG